MTLPEWDVIIHSYLNFNSGLEISQKGASVTYFTSQVYQQV